MHSIKKNNTPTEFQGASKAHRADGLPEGQGLGGKHRGKRFAFQEGKERPAKNAHRKKGGQT